MPLLENARYEKFAQLIAGGMGPIKAYRAAGYRSHPNNASRLTCNVGIVARVRELQDKAATMTIIDRAWVIAKLVEGVEMAEKKKDLSNRNRSLELVGRAVGVFTEKDATPLAGEYANLPPLQILNQVTIRIENMLKGRGTEGVERVMIEHDPSAAPPPVDAEGGK